MKTKKNLLLLAVIAVMTGVFTQNAAAQGQGFDPAQFRQRQLDNYRERLVVKSDEDWNKIEPLIGAVMDAQREVRMGINNFGGGRGGGGNGSGGQTNRNRFGGPLSPEAEALQKALDDKESADELKSKIAKLREVRSAKEATLAKAQDDLRKALSSRQEAAAVLAGLLK